MRYPQTLDFTLQQVVVSEEISLQIQARKASLLILPFRPQPSLSLNTLASMAEQGIGPVCDDDMLKAARIALSMGLLHSPMLPIGLGCAFAIHRELPLKTPYFGTGIVLNIDISRFFDLKPQHRAKAGYSSNADFRRYWEQATADLSPANHWCWLIEFDYKG